MSGWDTRNVERDHLKIFMKLLNKIVVIEKQDSQVQKSIKMFEMSGRVG
jgi:hypothetical protein